MLLLLQLKFCYRSHFFSLIYEVRAVIICLFIPLGIFWLMSGPAIERVVVLICLFFFPVWFFFLGIVDEHCSCGSGVHYHTCCIEMQLYDSLVKSVYFCYLLEMQLYDPIVKSLCFCYLFPSCQPAKHKSVAPD
jgi:hypothetical protein